MQASWSEIVALLVALGSLAAAVFSAAAAFKAASASERSASEATRTNDIAIHGLRRGIYEDVIWMRGKIIRTPCNIDRDDTVKFHNSVRCSRYYFGDNAQEQLQRLLNEVTKYQLSEFKGQISKEEVVSELRKLADQARDALEPYMSLSH